MYMLQITMVTLLAYCILYVIFKIKVFLNVQQQKHKQRFVKYCFHGNAMVEQSQTYVIAMVNIYTFCRGWRVKIDPYHMQSCITIFTICDN